MKTHLMRILSAGLLLLLLIPCSASSQQIPQVAQGESVGMPSVDYVDPATGRLNVSIPLVSDTAQRGALNFNYSVSYGGTGAWQVYCDPITSVCSWTPSSGIPQGPRPIMEGGLGWPTWQENAVPSYVVDSAGGAEHALGGLTTSTSAGCPWRSTDASGILVTSSDGCTTPSHWTVTSKQGIQFIYHSGDDQIIQDPNGNEMELTENPTTYDFGPDFFDYSHSWYLWDTVGRSWTYQDTTDTSGCPSGVTNVKLWTTPGPSNVNSGARQFKFCYASVSIATSLGGSGNTEYSYSATFLTRIILPDGTTWQFDYNGYGDIQEIHLPLGGTITYTYTTTDDQTISGQKIRTVATRTLNDGTSSPEWTYAINIGGSSSGSTTTDPDGNDTAYTTTASTSWPEVPLHVTQTQYYQGSASGGTLLKTVSKNFNTDYYNPFMDGYMLLPAGETPSFPSGKTSEVSMYYNDLFSFYDYAGTGYTVPYGLVSTVEYYDWGSGSPGALLSRKSTGYYFVADSNYQTANLLTLPYYTGVFMNGNWCSADAFWYDTASAQSSGVTVLHGSAPNSVRGNLTQTGRWLNSGSACSGNGAYILSYQSVYDTGMVKQATDPLGNVTTYAYAVTSPNWYGSRLTSVTNALSQTMNLSYDWPSGLLSASQDANGNSTTYTYDSMLRPSQVTYPNGGEKDVAFSFYSGFLYNQLTTKIDSSNSANDYTHFDGLGRADRLAKSNGQSVVYDQQDLCYGNSGNAGFVSTPYHSNTGFTATKVCSSTGESFTYDALGRVTQATKPGSNTVTTTYSDNCATVADEAGKTRKSCSDAMGRVTDVWEDPSGFNYHTTYTYDLLGNLSGSSQSGQTRGFTYDSLARLKSENSIPETGTTTYVYDADTNCASPHTYSGLLISKTDARGIHTCYQYDALNRLTQKNYSDSSPNTPTAKYYYDSTDCLSLSACYNVGRRTGMSEGSATSPTTKWAYDKMGNILRESRTINSHTLTTSYSYNLDSSIATITYPGSRVVTYSYNIGQRALSAKDTTNTINYAQSASYEPTGALTSAVYGYVSGGFAGITESRGYNSLLQLTSIQATSSAGTALNLTYSYPTSTNNGNISTQTNNETSNRTQTYTYDSLNRLLTAQSSATSGSDCWGQSFGNNATPPTLATDALANLLYTSATKCSSPAPQFTGDGSNHISTSGFSYDSDGDNTADAQWSYTYDAENRIVTASGMSGGPYCYTYDADGMRVMKAHASGGSCTGTVTVDMLYWRNIAGNTIAETDSSGSTANSGYHEYVFFAGRRIARADWGSSSFTVYYHFVDHLGSTRSMTSAAGTVCFKADYLPYGAENTPSGFTDSCNTTYKFTGYERDAETGLDYASARYYNQRLGRFMSGDPLPGDPSDPQSLNHYAYVRNNPLRFTDPTGMIAQGDPCEVYTCIDPNDFSFYGGSPGPTGYSGFLWPISGPTPPPQDPPAPPPPPPPPAKKPLTPKAQVCEEKVQEAVNNELNTSSQLQGPLIDSRGDSNGLIHGAYNFNVYVTQDLTSLAATNCGRFYSSHLHIIIPFNGCNTVGNDPFVFVATSGGTLFTAHIDSADPVDLVGLLTHFFGDYLLNRLFHYSHGC